MREHVTDPYVREAKRQGYHSRAAFKLLEVDARDRLFRPGMTVVDLGAAPGSWSQVAAERVGRAGWVIAVDVLPVMPIAGVLTVQADLSGEAGLEAVAAALNGKQADLVLSDMAPNLSGVRSLDQDRSLRLAELALQFCGPSLKPGGCFLAKVFQGPGVEGFVASLRTRFRMAAIRKPGASRERSAEVYVLGKDFHGPDREPGLESI
jgi:23S rRNA (uridine2552-2'-O)-methyltransferase